MEQPHIFTNGQWQPTTRHIYTSTGWEQSHSAGDPPAAPAVAIDNLDDLSAVFLPTWTSPAVEGDGFTTTSTPYGDGFDFVVPDSKVTTWDPTMKDILAVKYPDADPEGTAERWRFNAYFPSQTLAQHWNSGLFWQWHTDGSSGHHIGFYYELGPNFRIARQTGPGATYDYTVGPVVPWDSWISVRIDVKWSSSTDGYYKVWMGGTQYINATNVRTVWDGEPYLQFGWYAILGSLTDSGTVTNRVRFGGITVEPIGG